MDESKFLTITPIDAATIVEIQHLDEYESNTIYYKLSSQGSYTQLIDYRDVTITIPFGQSLRIYGENESGYHNNIRIKIKDNPCRITGHLTSLISPDCPTSIISKEDIESGYDDWNRAFTYADCFVWLFSGSDGAIDISELVFPLDASPGAYFETFLGCTLLGVPSVLPAERIFGDTYYGMFKNCTGIETGPYIAASEYLDTTSSSSGHTSESCAFREMFAGSDLKNLTVNFTASPEYNNVFWNWLPDHPSSTLYAPANREWNGNTPNMNIPSTWTVRNINNECTVYAGVSPEGTARVLGGGTYPINTQVTLSVVDIDPDYTFAYWTDGSVTPTITFIATGNTSYSAVLVEKARDYDITTSSSPYGVGTVQPSGGTYSAGTHVTLSAITTDNDYVFDHWNDGNTDNPREIVVGGDSGYTAYFEYRPEYEVTAYDSPIMGLATITGQGTYRSGQTCTLTATNIDPHWEVYYWVKDGTQVPGSEGASAITFTVNDDTSVRLNLRGKEYQITAKSNYLNAATITGGGTYRYGAQVTLTVTNIQSGYTFRQWSDGNTNTSRTFTCNGNATYTAEFDIAEGYAYISATTSPEGVATITGEGLYETGSTVTLTVTDIDDDYIFTGWSNGDTTTSTTVTVEESETITANFTLKPEYTVSTAVNPTGKAEITGGGTYKSGNTATLTVTNIDNRYLFDHWSNGATTESITVQVTGNTTYTAYLEAKPTISVTTVVVPMGKARIIGGGTYDIGSQVTLEVTDIDPDYTFDHWSDGSTGMSVSFTAEEDITYQAWLKQKPSYRVVTHLDPESGGTITGDGYYIVGREATLTVTPTSDYIFSHWSDGNTDNPRTITVNDNVELTAYLLHLYDITTASSPTSGGTTTGDGRYPYGTNITIEATPAQGYKFKQWNDGNTDNPRIVAVTGDTTYTATFAKLYDITVNSLPQGLCRCNGNGQYELGEEVEISVDRIDNNYRFDHWNDGNTDNPRTITVSGNAVYTAYLKRKELKQVSAVVYPSSKGKVEGTGMYESGSTVTLTATNIDPFFEIDHWSDGSTGNSITFTVTNDIVVVLFLKRNEQFTYLIDSEPLNGLYINGSKVDEFENMDVAMTYQSRDASDPEAVRSNYSKTVSLPGTPENNRIFSSLYNVSSTISGFNPKERVDFKLFRNSEIIEKGYITLDDIQNSNGNITYNITLYGGIGDFFYSLQIDDEGNEKTLDKLKLPLDMINDHLLTLWDFEHIKQGWEKLKQPFDPTDRSVENWIVAAPTYGGYGDDMDNGNAVLLAKYYNGSGDTYGHYFHRGPVVVEKYDKDKQVWYTDKEGWVGLECQREMTEWETRDLRSSQQRPAIRTRLIMDAIKDPENNGGYEVEMSESLSADTYINDSWIICDRLDFASSEDNLNPVTVSSYTSTVEEDPSVSGTVTPAIQVSGREQYFDLSGMTNVKLQVCAYPMIYVNNDVRVYNDEVRKVMTFRECRAKLKRDGQYVKRYPPHWYSASGYYGPGNASTETAYNVFTQAYVGNAFVCYLEDNHGNKSNIQVLMSHLLRDGFFWVEDRYLTYIANHYDVDRTQVKINNTDIIKRKDANGNVWFVTEDVMPMSLALPSENGVTVKYICEYIHFPFAVDSVGNLIDTADCRDYMIRTADFGIAYPSGIASWEWIKDSINDQLLGTHRNREDEKWTMEKQEELYDILYTRDWWNCLFYIASGNDMEDTHFQSSFEAWKPVIFKQTVFQPLMDTDNEGAQNGYYEGTMQSVQATNVTKELMFGRMGTAYDFLMSLSKMFSWRFRVDKDEKKVYIERVNEYYKDGPIDITERVDWNKPVKVIPNVTEYKYLNYELESSEDLYVNRLYNTKYHKPYSAKKFNTGVNLSSEVNDIFESSPFNSTADYQMKSPYFFIRTDVPQPFLLPWCKETLWMEDGGANTDQTLELERTGLASVSNLQQQEGPVFLCAYNNQFEPVEVNMTLAFFNGFTPWKCIVSDNLPVMTEIMDNNCILSPYQHFSDDIASILNYAPGESYITPINDGYMYGKPSTRRNDVERIAYMPTEIPQFTTTLSGMSTYINEPEHPFVQPVGQCIYPQYHKWSEDMYDRNGKKVEVYIRLPRDIRPDELLRRFVWWENAEWIFESIEDYDLNKADSVKCTLIKVANRYNYLN